MDKILSARVDEDIILQINRISQRLKLTKKKVIEDAIRAYVNQMEKQQKTDVLKETFGSWIRDETPNETIRKSRDAFNKSMRRSHS